MTRVYGGSRRMHTHIARDYWVDNPPKEEKYTPTICGVTKVKRNIDNYNPTCRACYKLLPTNDRPHDDRLFQMWLNEYSEAYRHQLEQGFRPERAGYIAYAGTPSYCKWLGHRLHDLRE